MFEIISARLREGDTAAILLLLLVMLVTLLLLGLLACALRLRRLSRQLARLTRGIEGGNLEQTLTAYMDTVDQAIRRMDALEQAMSALQTRLPGCLQRVNLVRYDAFDGVGGEQSFSIALLDGRGDGVVLTSVYSRMDVRIYAKSIQGGRASHTLSQEEERVLQPDAFR